MPDWTLLYLTLQVSIVSAPLPYVCHRGNYLHTPRIGPDVCLPCPDGISFMPESLHRNRQCFNCTQVLDPSVEVVVSACNKTHDSVILCREGYYRQVARNDQDQEVCGPCSVCDHVTRPCQGYHDAVCCLPSYKAVWNKNGFFECKERPIECGAGEFLSLKTEQCTPCPQGTFMTSDKHNHTNCQLCQTLDDIGPHQEIVQPCNRTHPPEFACQDGFFKNTMLELKETNCVPCQTCEGEGGHCSRSHNSSQELICWFSEHVTEESATVNHTAISVTPGSPPLPVCGENQYLSTHPGNNNTSTCLPCPDGTHLDDGNHTRLVRETGTSEDETQTRYYIFLTIIITMLTLTLIIFSLWGRLICFGLKRREFSLRICAKQKILICLTVIYFFVLINFLLITSAFYLSNLLSWINIAVCDVIYILCTVIQFALMRKKINKKSNKLDYSLQKIPLTDVDNNYYMAKQLKHEKSNCVTESLLTKRTATSDADRAKKRVIRLNSQQNSSHLNVIKDKKWTETDNFPDFLSHSKQHMSLPDYFEIRDLSVVPRQTLSCSDSLILREVSI